MKLTTKAAQAINAVIDVALHQQRSPVKLSSVADRQRISLSYLELLFSKMRRNGLVASTRGPGGGYRLARDASEISMANIVDAVDDGDYPVNADSVAVTGRPSRIGMTDFLWTGLATTVRTHLQSVTVADLLNSDDLSAAKASAARSAAARLAPPQVPRFGAAIATRAVSA